MSMELGEPDDSGRRRPVPIEGSEYEIELDYILAAIGQKSDIDYVMKYLPDLVERLRKMSSIK
jgi:NADPH-dependent glutamate synthase beta subunit-like oxidoreductase